MTTAPTAHADTETVEHLLGDLAAGRLVVPTFQRGLRWRDADQVKLLDSVLRGIPIGTLLLSDPFTDGPGAAPGSRLVLDGQQRLHTLRHLISPVESGSRQMLLDTSTRTFRLGRVETLRSDSTLIPVGLLGDASQLISTLTQVGVSAATLTAALLVSQRLREYRVPVYLLRDATEELARMVFDRVNASGRRLRQAEVFNALHAREGERPVSSTTRVVDRLKRLGFGELDEDEITKAVAVLTGHDPGRDVRAIRFIDAPDVMKRTETALTHAITFLRDDAEVPHLLALPYVMPLLVLARFFDQHASPTPRTRILLRRWLWRGAATMAHQGGRATLRAALDVVQGDEHSAVQALLSQVPRDASRFKWTPDLPMHKRFAADRVVLCALAARCPLDLRDGSVLDAASLIAGASLPSPVSRAARARTWATALLHPRMHHGRLRKLVLAALPTALASHVVSEAACEALRAGDDEAFAAHRGADLQERVRRFLVARAEWSASDLPALSSFAELP